MGKIKRELDKMKREVTPYCAWHQIEAEDKILFFPTDGSSLDKLLRDHVGGKHTIIYGHGARLKESGMLGATPWYVFPNYEEAKSYLSTYYGEYSNDEHDLPRIFGGRK